MKPEIPPAISTPAESRWVEAELIRSLMRTARNTQLFGLVLIPIFLSVLWSDVTLGALALWSLAAFSIAGARFWIIRVYVRDVLTAGAQAHLEFFRRYRLLWTASALVWGLSTLLFFDRASLQDQFVCWLILSGLAMFSINSLSNHLQTVRRYLDALAGGAIAVMLWRVGVELQFGGPPFQYWIIG
ncbi:MAG: hypothetical protein H7255_10240, partial [Ramlibacter sp.]|nr:hypothetical protein [Ramlibacter sp.]